MAEQTVTLDNGISICHETFGDPSDPTVLLIMGLGGPMGWWSTVFCENLAARGLHVVRFDNRDVGRSSRVEATRRMRRGDLVGTFVGVAKRLEYTLDDMAEDGFGLLSAIGVEQAHVVGVSMGGMIAQTMAIARPERVLSLASVMSGPSRLNPVATRAAGSSGASSSPATCSRTNRSYGLSALKLRIT